MNTVEIPEKVWREMSRELNDLREFREYARPVITAHLGGLTVAGQRRNAKRLEGLRDARYWLDDVGIPAHDVAKRYAYRSADEMVDAILKHERSAA